MITAILSLKRQHRPEKGHGWLSTIDRAFAGIMSGHESRRWRGARSLLGRLLGACLPFGASARGDQADGHPPDATPSRHPWPGRALTGRGHTRAYVRAGRGELGVSKMGREQRGGTASK